MQIYKTGPIDWRDLQQRVCDIFNDIGCNAEVEKDVTVTLRDADRTIEVDVWVEDNRQTPNVCYQVECKNWSDNIPQEKVVALSEYMRKTGANSGYIISKAGFQEGAIAHAKGTNIQLLTFDEFQEHYWLTWLLDCFKHNSDSIQQDISAMQGSLYPGMPWNQALYGDLTHHYPDNLTEFHGFMSWHSAFSGRLSYLCARYILPQHVLEPEMLETELSWEEIEGMISGANLIAKHHSESDEPYSFEPDANNLREIYIGIRAEYSRIKDTLLAPKI